MKRIPGKVIMANLFAAKIATVNKISSRFKNLKIDDPILYSLNSDGMYSVGHFAGFDEEDGAPRVFLGGRTSMTANECNVVKIDIKDGGTIMMIADQYLQ